MTPIQRQIFGASKCDLCFQRKRPQPSNLEFGIPVPHDQV